MAIVYTEHLKLRLRIRKIPYEYPRKIFSSPEQIYYDNLEENFIAIKKLRYNQKQRNMMIAYKRNNENIEIITIHPMNDEKIVNRVLSGRWMQNEQKV